MTLTDGAIFRPVVQIPAWRNFRLPITVGLVLLIMAVTLPLVVFFQISIKKAQKNGNCSPWVFRKDLRVVFFANLAS
ncbi:MAG: hypothetical protein O3C34_15430, partial [Proteobacteria bacterium]|nr:hypothetical protein [Pseudomonadota bacterium]